MGAAPTGAAAEPVVISVGSVNVDFQVRTDRWPGAGETLLADDFLMAGGGKAANVAYLARRLEAGAVLVARVGDDLLADHALAPLRELDVDLRHVDRVSGEATGAALIDVRADGEKVILLAANANDVWGPDDERDAESAVQAAPPGSVVTVDLEVPAAVVRRSLEAAHEAGHVVVLDPSPADRLDDGLAPLADYVTPNQTEAELLTGVTVRSPADGRRAGEELVKQGVAVALVKLGGDGCMLVSDDHRLHVRPASREAVDTTGAGDAFAAGLSVALLEGRPPPDAACVAVASGTLAVTRFGSQASYPTRDELDREVRAVTVEPVAAG